MDLKADSIESPRADRGGAEGEFLFNFTDDGLNTKRKSRFLNR